PNVSVEGNIDVVRKFGEALTNRDWTAFHDLVADDCEWTEVPSGRTILGARGLAEACRTFTTAFPDFSVESVTLIGEGELVVNANTSAVTILLPAISSDVGAPVTQLQWAVTGYMLVGAAVIVTAGALGDVFGRRLIFLGGLALFVASCVLIALSTSGSGVIV